MVSVALLLYYARLFPLGAIGLPFVTALTCLVYFGGLLPLAEYSGVTSLMGMTLPNADERMNLHSLVLLSLAGSFLAFHFFLPRRRYFPPNFRGGAAALAAPRNNDTNDRLVFAVLTICVLGVTIYMLATKQIVLFGGELDWQLKNENLLFLNQAYNLAIPVALAIYVRRGGDLFSWVLVGIVAAILITLGFRFRLVLLLGGLCGCTSIARRWRITVPLALLAAIVALLMLNVFGAVRKYNQGLDLASLKERDLMQIALHPGGEIGPVMVAAHAANDTFRAGTIGIDPWIIGVARLVPSIIWSDKPSPDYLKFTWDGFDYWAAQVSGIAPPQVVEILWQFGWLGITPLTFIYFSIASLIFRYFWLGRSEYDIVGISLVPWHFGYYMQSRGYFAQIFADTLFVIGSLILLSLLARRAVKMTPARDRVAVVQKQHS